MSKKQAPTIKLDWYRLLGFDQAEPPAENASEARLSAPRLAKLGSKVGTKSGLRTRI
jgi:hypothetical protein